jgi:cysteinyl-tRNA synthetase
VTFRVFNTLARQKEDFAPLEPGVVRMYNCGPTVYKRQHIGNFRAYLFADVLRRWLEHLGHRVLQVMNVTDVGHLQRDEVEAGEDKIQAEARERGVNPWRLTREATEVFLADLKRLGVRPALLYPRATEHIPEMLEMIDGLVEKGYAYRSGENVYFDVSRFERYGQLSGNTVDDLVAGARVEVREDKKNPADFALWKSDARHVMQWASRYGAHGYPGWHIECSAMARKHLGDRLDIHTGGEDNIFPHHECEIAQSEAYTGVPLARYWMHARYLLVDGGKMSKRLGNVWTLDDVEERGFELRVFRYAIVRAHYRQQVHFTWSILEEARSALEGLDDLVRRLRDLAGSSAESIDGGARGADAVAEARAAFEAGNDDLNTPQAFAALFTLRARVLAGDLGPAAARDALALLLAANEVLGVIRTEEESLDAEVEARIAERQRARAEKRWADADRIRDELQASGIVLEDTPRGVSWRRSSAAP